jgi:hypothetical protein
LLHPRRAIVKLKFPAAGRLLEKPLYVVDKSKPETERQRILKIMKNNEYLQNNEFFEVFLDFKHFHGKW